MHQVKRSSLYEPITTTSSANVSLSPKNKVRGFNITLQHHNIVNSAFNRGQRQMSKDEEVKQTNYKSSF